MKKINDNLFEDFIPFNKENANGRIYKNESFPEEALVKYRESVENGYAFGEYLDHGNKDNEHSFVNLHDIIIKVHDFNVKNEGMQVWVELFYNRNYDKLNYDIDNNPENFSIVPRTVGTYDPKTKEVTINEIISFDIVDKTNSSFNNIISNEEIYE